jgi:hypothetical protein
MLSVAVFFGLRSQRVDAPSAPGAAPSAPTAAALPAPLASAGVPAAAAPERVPAAPPTPSDQVAKQVSAALDAQRPKLVSACLKSTAAAPAKPARWSLNYTFGPDGQQVARGVREARREGSPELTTCVLAALEPVTIEPPGASVTVEVLFQLP